MEECWVSKLTGQVRTTARCLSLRHRLASHEHIFVSLTSCFFLQLKDTRRNADPFLMIQKNANSFLFVLILWSSVSLRWKVSQDNVTLTSAGSQSRAPAVQTSSCKVAVRRAEFL